MPPIEHQLSHLKSVTPRIAWKHATRDFILMECQKTQCERISLRSRISAVIAIIPSFVTQLLSFSVSRRMLAVPVSVVLLVVLGSGFAVSAARSSVPGDALYPVKIASERVQISLTWKGSVRSKLNTEFAKRRLDEVAVLAKSPEVKKEHIEQAMSDFKQKVESARQDLAHVKEEGSSHDVVEAAKTLDATTKEYEQKLEAVKKDVSLPSGSLSSGGSETSPESKREMLVSVNAALDAVEEVSVNSLTTLVEQANNDGEVTKEEVKKILNDHIDAAVPQTLVDPLVLRDPSTTKQIQQKTEDAKVAIANNDLTKALDAVKETKALVRATEKQKNEARLQVTTKEVELQNPVSEIQPPQVNGSQVKGLPGDDNTILDKQKKEVSTSNGSLSSGGSETSQSQALDSKDKDAPNPSILAPKTLAPNTDTPGTVIIEEK